MWEDYYEMGQVHPSWVIDPCTIAADGIKIINFHPIHLYLNMMSLEKYLALKQEVPDVSSATERDLSRYVTDGDGPRNLLLTFIEHLSHGNESWRIKDICETWTRSRTHSKEATCTANG